METLNNNQEGPEFEEAIIQEALVKREEYYSLNTRFVKNVFIFSLCWFVISLILFVIVYLPMDDRMVPDGVITNDLKTTIGTMQLIKEIGFYVFSVVSILSGVILFVIRQRNKREFTKYFVELSLILEDHEFFDRKIDDRRVDEIEIFNERRIKEDRRVDKALIQQNQSLKKNTNLIRLILLVSSTLLVICVLLKISMPYYHVLLNYANLTDESKAIYQLVCFFRDEILYISCVFTVISGLSFYLVRDKNKRSFNSNFRQTALILAEKERNYRKDNRS